MKNHSLLENAINRLPEAMRNQALEISATPDASPELGRRFQSLQTAPLTGLAELPTNEFNFVSAMRAFDGIAYPAAIVGALRESARLLREHGLLYACFGKLFSVGDLTDLARDLDFQILSLDSTTVHLSHILWRKRAPGWRSDLAEHAAFATIGITHIANACDGSPVVPNRGRFTAVNIQVDALPSDVDLFDLHVLAAGIRATAISISGQQIIAQLPNLEQTGLIPVELHWFGQPLTPEPGYVRVISPGPLAPRITAIKTSATGVTVCIEELARPDEVTVAMDGAPVWAFETRLVDPNTQSFECNLHIPEEMPPGSHEIQLKVGWRKLVPFTLEVH